MELFNPFSLLGKTILITGASSGIGRGIAIVCSKMGAKVIAVARNKERLEETLRLMTGDAGQVFSCDLTSPEDTNVMVASLPLLDGVVHCAGVGQRIPCKLLKQKDVDDVMNINFKAPVLLQKELLAQKRIKKGGSVVFIASIASTTPSFGNAVYSGSKGAIVSYANCLSLELATRQIRVNCISPAMVWTDLVIQEGADEEQLKSDESKYPLKRYGTPDDIAYLTVYMLSDASTWMTGSNVRITGGVF